MLYYVVVVSELEGLVLDFEIWVFTVLRLTWATLWWIIMIYLWEASICMFYISGLIVYSYLVIYAYVIALHFYVFLRFFFKIFIELGLLQIYLSLSGLDALTDSGTQLFIGHCGDWKGDILSSFLLCIVFLARLNLHLQIVFKSWYL